MVGDRHAPFAPHEEVTLVDEGVPISDSQILQHSGALNGPIKGRP
jgi:hypothetical protein